MIILGICLILTIFLEILFKSSDVSVVLIIISYFLILFFYINISFTDCIERYLADADYTNPFIIIMIEGIFEFFMSIIYSIGKEPFKEMKYQYGQKDTFKFIFLAFLLILYLLFSAALNAYKIYVNVTFTPTARSFMDFLLLEIIFIFLLMKKFF